MERLGFGIIARVCVRRTVQTFEVALSESVTVFTCGNCKPLVVIVKRGPVEGCTPTKPLAVILYEDAPLAARLKLTGEPLNAYAQMLLVEKARLTTGG